MRTPNSWSRRNDLKNCRGLSALAVFVGTAVAQSCGPYPNTLTNGQPADANQMMESSRRAAETLVDRRTLKLIERLCEQESLAIGEKDDE